MTCATFTGCGPDSGDRVAARQAPAPAQCQVPDTTRSGFSSPDAAHPIGEEKFMADATAVSRVLSLRQRPMRSVDPGIVPAPVVWVVDDDRAVCRALYRLLRAAALDVELMRSGRELLERLTGAIPDCLLLDLWLEDATGLELLPQFQLRAGHVPVVFMSGDADVRASVQAMKSGAVDFLEKPVDEGALLDAVIRAVARGRAWREARAARESASRRLATLTPREREVFSLVATGKPNKRIAAELGTTEKTIKVHRGRVMQKLEASSVVDLVRLAQQVGELAA